MSLDDLIKGVSLFKSGMKDYAISKASTDMAQQMQALNAQQVDQEEKIMKQTELANQFALKLGAAGADAAQIDELAGRLGVSAGAQYAAQTVPASQIESQQSRANLAAQQHGYRMEELGLKQPNAKEARLLNKDQMNFINTRQKEFSMAARKPMESLNMINVAKEALASNNPIAHKSLINFLARASGEVGALTESDKAPFGGSTAMVSRIQQAKEDIASGKYTPKNKALVAQLLSTYEIANKRNIKSIRDRVAGAAAKQAKFGAIPLDQNQIAEMLYSTDEQPAASPQQFAPAQPTAGGLDLNAWIKKK